MYQTYTLREKLKQLNIILIPILVTQLAMYAMNFFDTMMSGQYSPSDLAGVAIGSSLWVPVFTGLSGILLAITPIVAQLAGAKNEKDAAYSVIQAVYLATVMAIIIFLVGAFTVKPLLLKMNLETSVYEVALQYLIALGIGIIPLFIFNVLRSFIDALGKTRVTMVITLLSLPINVVFNYLLIFGKFGFPELGGVGAGYASAITYWLIALIAAYIVVKQQPFANFGVFRKFHAVSIQKWKEILKIGVPIGFAIFFETSIFAAVTLFMSSFNTVTIASHQAALNFSSFLYMIPLSISMALTIVVGFEAGAKRYRDARVYSWIGIAFAVVLAFACGVVLLIFRTEIAGIYTSDPKVLALTSNFLIYAVFFQLSDAILAPVQGALRGYKDVNITFLMAFISFWVIGLPLGYYLANFTEWQAFGYWVGLIAGLAVGASCLLARLVYLEKKFLNHTKNAV
ncbi:MATE family efflux transporter [Mesobacillus harenae]|uniref:MATE family efflux transporter n=1 Tax=Mesobacillus harenae TaxID=2213203 RepID=UPI001580E904|nr:MATE family efflux transporter [Mesobacillus harenae]